MAFLVITESIEETIDFLQANKQIEERLFQETGNELHKAKAEDFKNRLDAAKRYKRVYDRKTEYQKIKHLQQLNPQQYIEKCVEITKGMKGVWFDKDRLLFRVQIQRNGNRIYLGYFDTPDDAMEILKRYI